MNQIEISHQINHSHNRRAEIHIFRSEAEEHIRSQIHEAEHDDNSGRDGRQRIIAPQPFAILKQLIVHIQHPKEREQDTQREQHGVRNAQQRRRTRKLPAVEQKGNRFRHTEHTADPAHQAKKLFIDRGGFQSLVPVKLDDQHQAKTDAVGNQNSGQVDPIPCAGKTTGHLPPPFHRLPETVTPAFSFLNDMGSGADVQGDLIFP